jgi:hypothetical protein
MALEGQLSDFNLAEILQLLASQQKSGFLNLETKRNMVFIFDKGVLVSTRDRRSRSRDPLESFRRATVSSPRASGHTSSMWPKTVRWT